jgi:RNA polymerase sigma-70 factor (ECF subfamily)
METGDRSYRRKYPAPRGVDYDALLTAVGARNDGEAFTRLFDHFGPRVQSQLLRLGIAPVAAEDVTQDVMETIWRKAHLYDPGKAGAATWILQIARNRQVDVRRRSREFAVDAEHFFNIPDAGETSDDRIDAAWRQERVRAALDALPQDQLRLVTLAFFEELSHSTIAQMLNLPLGTVKSRLRLAFGRLRRLLIAAGISDA